MKLLEMLLTNCEDIEIKKYIDDNLSEINETNNRTWSPLGVACLQGNVAIVNYLLEKGANVEYADEYATCLLVTMMARIPRSTKIQIINILHAHKADLDAGVKNIFAENDVVFEKNLTPLDIAVLQKDTVLFNLLLRLGANKEKVMDKSKMEKFLTRNNCYLFLLGLYRDKSANKANSTLAEYGNKLPKDVVKLIVDHALKDSDQTPLTKSI